MALPTVIVATVLPTDITDAVPAVNTPPAAVKAAVAVVLLSVTVIVPFAEPGLNVAVAEVLLVTVILDIDGLVPPLTVNKVEAVSDDHNV